MASQQANAAVRRKPVALKDLLLVASETVDVVGDLAASQGGEATVANSEAEQGDTRVKGKQRNTPLQPQGENGRLHILQLSIVWWCIAYCS